MAYNVQPQWYYRQRSAPRPGRPGPQVNGGPARAPSREPPRRDDGGERRPSQPRPAGKNTLERLLPASMDSGDLFLVATLLFLYLETRDQDFLIILIVVGLSLFKHDTEDG